MATHVTRTAEPAPTPERRTIAAKQPSPSAEQLLIGVLLTTIAEALDALAAVDDGARRDHAGALSELTLTCASLWSHVPHVHVDVESRGLSYEGEPVLASEDDGTGLVTMLREAEISRLSLAEGVETDELPRLLEVLHRKRSLDVDGDLDLVTMLFHEDFDLIRYAVAGTTPSPGAVLTSAAETESLDSVTLSLAGPTTAVDTESTPAHDGGAVPTEGADERREAVREDARTPDRARGIVELEKFDSTLYFLDRREIEYLRDAIDREYGRDHARNVLALLLDVLEQQAEPEVREEVITILTTFLPYLLGTGQFESIAYLMGELRALPRKVEIRPEHRSALETLRVSVSETEAIAQLFHALEAEEVEADPDRLGVLLKELRPEAIQTVMVWVGQLKNPTAKSALVSAIEGLFTDSPAALASMLDASDRTVVHRALGIARTIRDADFAEPVAGVLDSPDESTRRLALRALAAIGTSAALKGAVGVIDDPDPEVRRLLFEALAERPFRAAHKRLAGVLTTVDLEERELRERRALFEAFGAVAGAAGVATLEPVLLGKGSLKRRPSSETRACAAVALGVIGTPAARFALERAAKDRDPVVRSAASSALRGS